MAPEADSKASAAKALFEALQDGNASRVKALLERGVDANAKDERLQTALMRASDWHGIPEIINLLIDHGADINERNEGGWTPLIAAVSGYKKEAACVLIKRGADLNVQTTEESAYKAGTTALHEAVTIGGLDIVNLLIEHFADVDIKNDRGETALVIAARAGRSEIVKALKEAPGRQRRLREAAAETQRIRAIHEAALRRQRRLKTIAVKSPKL